MCSQRAGSEKPVSSFRCHKGIPLNEYFHQPIEKTLEYYYDELISKSNNSPAPIFHWEKFVHLVTTKDDVSIVWFTDDNIETHFDLLFIQKLLNTYEYVRITLVPKNGNFETDTSWSKLYEHFLQLNIYEELRVMKND